VKVAVILIASWYSIASVGSQGIMANGKKLSDSAFTCATNLYPLGSKLLVTNIKTGKNVVVRVTDRINKRFTYKRIDLTKAAFKRIANLREGLVKVRVEPLE
jgi:rare lipoprotein A